MEQKLAEFRARRQAENAVKNETFAASLNPEETVDTQPESTSASEGEGSRGTVGGTRGPGQTPAKDRSDWFLDSALGRWLTTRKSVLSNLTLLKFLLWLVLLGLFVELEFGLPFFVVSLFYWLYEGLRSPAARQPGELSAYSVFNPDCQPLLGSLTAEQLEGEMGYRPLANR
ncbi:SAYSvFN domain-containing protein 1 [Takifugu flavidus]|uniref:SAYSvFN domain-containing protein 1 n=1 Tax=Takifugu flavidus TaxID=433684 RepID=A0A5C6NRE5_9TELE|nr:SAYSvFN domain-containing protein 1 [Takifugu flavidus]TWW68720.1 SAYSvFN domain-containing protein 1 [Takifugu flavidus]